jgi:osmoprotectant transport system substrate-binding protein
MILHSRRSTITFAATGLALALAATACGSSSSGTTAAGSSSAATSAAPSAATSSAPSLPALCGGQSGSGKVVIGAASFAENETLAAIYAAALKECGYSTSVKDFDSREVYYPELKKGAIQIVPEYAATLTDFINDAANGANAPSKASGVIATTVSALKAELPSSLAVLNPATATDKNGFAVKKSFATANHITTMSQLGAYSKAHPLSLAGPSECPTRPFCEPGLKKTYGFKISKFVQTDEGGPLTDKALKSGKATVGLLFTSDPTLASNGLVFLTDDKNLQASDNVIPLVASSLSTGAAASALNAVQAKLNQSTLVSINKAVQIDRGTPSAVATQFLQQEGLS